MDTPESKPKERVIWMSLKEAKAWEKIRKRFDREFLDMVMGSPHHFLRMERRAKKAQMPGYNAKFAYIFVGHTRRMAMVDPDMKTAYKLSGYDKTLIPWPRFRFDRWCRGMDL